MPLAQAEKARGAMNPSQKTCLRIKYRFLRPQERYVLSETPGDRGCRREAAGESVYDGICGLEPVYPDFHARTPDWYPAQRRSDGSDAAREVPFPPRLPPVAVANGIKKPPAIVGGFFFGKGCFGV